MFDMAITSPVSTPSPGYAAGQAPEKAAAKPAPKTDVIDLSKPPTPEQAERMRSAGILGYGSISASKTVTAHHLSGNTSVTHFTVDYQSEYFDLVNRTTVRTASHGAGVFSAGGSAFASVTAQFAQSWDNSSWRASVLYESGFTQKMGGLPEWYIPSHQNEDGTWSLAQFGPSPTTTVSGYHSVLASAQHSDGQTELSLSETTVRKSVSISPSQERPAGAVDHINENFDRIITDELLERIDKLAQTLYRFDTRA